VTDPCGVIFEALERAGYEPMGSPPTFRSRCPGHDGDNPTALRVGIGNDGRALIHCFRGCSAERVLAPLGLTTIDLYPMELRRRGGRRDLALAPSCGRKTADVLLELCRDRGIGYRATANERMWLVEPCPCCFLHALIVCENDQDRARPGRVLLSCMGGCEPAVVLDALLGVER
jgi:hypothetical protein